MLFAFWGEAFYVIRIKGIIVLIIQIMEINFKKSDTLIFQISIVGFDCIYCLNSFSHVFDRIFKILAL